MIVAKAISLAGMPLSCRNGWQKRILHNAYVFRQPASCLFIITNASIRLKIMLLIRRTIVSMSFSISAGLSSNICL